MLHIVRRGLYCPMYSPKTNRVTVSLAIISETPNSSDMLRRQAEGAEEAMEALMIRTMHSAVMYHRCAFVHSLGFCASFSDHCNNPSSSREICCVAGRSWDLKSLACGLDIILAKVSISGDVVAQQGRKDIVAGITMSNKSLGSRRPSQ